MQLRGQRCSSLQGFECFFLQDNSLSYQKEIIDKADNAIEMLKEIPEYKLLMNFQSFDQITRRHRNYIPKEKKSISFNTFSVDVVFKGAAISNRANPEDE
eukprot:TRINITY_DN1947_c0_g2_i6.p2 TRINITY_DN1947_c0_g2~~TRINITY_DN1947_c0_g2_i6.p2  ORF type:complete len:100 (-),score=24.46 TRINITY_DN1947_c0_g2_i6:770-1069(-)